MIKSKHIRSSGVLAHITSLPSPYGIGDIGYSSWKFLDFLQAAGQTLWQFLPTVPTSPVFDHSPYMGNSAFAGSPLLLSVDLLIDDELIDETIPSSASFSEYQTDYEAVTHLKSQILGAAFENFDLSDKSFLEFRKNSPWLQDYCLFMSLKGLYQQKGWFDWPQELAGRETTALAKAEKQLKTRIDYFAFEQFLFHKQWETLRQKAKEKNIRLIGDIPIYVGWDSADVWANQEIFELDPESHAPTQVAGVPPDYFSKTGQRWGNPLYRWNSSNSHVKMQLYKWWAERFRAIFKLVDIVRVDHFRGFEAYWSIPASQETAIKGKWIKGPGKEFFQEMYKSLGKLEIIAEDLGEITPEVIQMRQDLGFPGMKILQFGFDGNRNNPFLPFNFSSPNSVIYTGTHDNDTLVGWFLSNQVNDTQRLEIKRYCNKNSLDASTIHKDLIYLALSSTSQYAIFPLQDVLGFGNDCRMNRPGSEKGNWRWRCAERFLTQDTATWLRDQCQLFNRCHKQNRQKTAPQRRET